jgi:HD-GYP domain-containing protein (c-di-GMP phosphodiesterase class II)
MAPPAAGSQPETVTWPELMAATSLAADIGMALPLETGLATCLVAVELGRVVGLDEVSLTRVHHLALLQHIGCTAVASDVAEVVGDELLMRAHATLLDFSDQREMFGFMLAHVARANPVLARPMALARALVRGRQIGESAVDVCEAGQMLGERSGYDADQLAELATVYENWDGSGFPHGLSGGAIPVTVQVVQVATLMVNAERLLGRAPALALVRTRRGHTLSPAVVDTALRQPDRVLSPLAGGGSLWEAVMGAEAIPSEPPSGEEVDRALGALADLSDLKSPYYIGHSPGVADLAAEAGRVHGLGADEVRLLRRAGWVHDIGRIAVSSGIWDRRGPLSAEEQERVRMHPHHTRQVLVRSPFLSSLAEVAVSHHERLDGSGYHRGLPGSAQSPAARLLAAADTYRTKVEPRPHRDALTPAEASAHLHGEVAAGHLDGDAVEAVLVGAGHRAPRRTATHLTPREVEILGQVSLGRSMREIARSLTISPKTVDGHLQRIYPKIGVTTRSGATLYALEHGLLPTQQMRQEGENSP